jgi:hypothetical protein
MTKEQIIELLSGNLWTANDQCIEGIDRAAEKITIKFFLMEAEIDKLKKANTAKCFQSSERDMWP